MLHQWGYLAAGLVSILLTCSSLAMAAHYNVMSYGAKSDGETDSTKAFLATWAKACASPSKATVYIPKGEFLLHKVTFQGPCKNTQIFFRIDGSLVAPSDYKAIGSSEYWIYFQHVNGVIISGGIIDGKGASLWSCKASAKNCPTGATSLGFLGSQNIIISAVTSINSQMFHIAINGCQNVKIHGIKVSASGDSPNTDGIHVQYSTGVTIQSSRIGTGDDCISIGPGSRNLWIEHVSCGPGHGISIGSLGKELHEEGVQNVTVKTVTFAGTQNGVRIKSWARPSNGFIRDIFFQHVIMINVQNPIIIDQNYCPDNQSCPAQASGIRISNVKYEDIHGTSATPIAVKLDCSKKNPCRGIIMENVHLTYENKPAAASCSNAAVTVSGSVQPPNCL